MIEDKKQMEETVAEPVAPAAEPADQELDEVAGAVSRVQPLYGVIIPT